MRDDIINLNMRDGADGGGGGGSQMLENVVDAYPRMYDCVLCVSFYYLSCIVVYSLYLEGIQSIANGRF